MDEKYEKLSQKLESFNDKISRQQNERKVNLIISGRGKFLG